MKVFDMKVLEKKYRIFWCIALLLLIVTGFALIYPTAFKNSGVVALISAIIGVILTVLITEALLNSQSEAQKELLDKQSETQRELLQQQSEKETQKDKDIKIYEKKIEVYSEFSSKMWEMFSDIDINAQQKMNQLDKLRFESFDKLIFFLSPTKIEELSKVFEEMTKRNGDFDYTSLCKITHILKESLKEEEDKKEKKNEEKPIDYLETFYNAFEKRRNDGDEDEETPTNSKENVTEESKEKECKQPLTFWHFNIWGDQQLAAFKKGNWVLNLIEYGEENNWRTWKVENQVQPGDVVFLFRRGGDGYIGAFKVKETMVLKQDDYAKGKYTDEDIKLYDMYNVMEDGATYSSNIIVEPLAFNFKGIGYRTVRRRTIEKMVNDMGNVKFLFDRFEGNNLDEEPHRLEGKDKLDPDTPVKFDEEYLKKLKKQYNL
jgi:hypothetical protein